MRKLKSRRKRRRRRRYRENKKNNMTLKLTNKCAKEQRLIKSKNKLSLFNIGKMSMIKLKNMYKMS